MEVSDALQQATVKIQEKYDPDPTVGASGMIESPAYNPLVASFLGVTEPDAKEAKQVNDIYEWTKERATTDADALVILKDIRFRLGGSVTENNLSRIHRYVVLRREAASIENQAKAMEK